MHFLPKEILLMQFNISKIIDIFKITKLIEITVYIYLYDYRRSYKNPIYMKKP